jgi:hypothetical protein
MTQVHVVTVLRIGINWEQENWEVSKSSAIFRLFFRLKVIRRFNSVQLMFSMDVQHARLPRVKNTPYMRVRAELRK